MKVAMEPPPRMPRPSLDTLLIRMYRYYARESESRGLEYHETEEAHRLMSLQEAAARSCHWNFYELAEGWRVPIDPELVPVVQTLRAWKPFADRWKQEFPAVVLWDVSNPVFDAAYRYSALRPGYLHPSDEWEDPVTLALSVLAPVYVTYTRDIDESEDWPQIRFRDFPERYRDRVAALGALTEEMFGFHRLDENTVRTPVPGLCLPGGNTFPDEITLMDCLFTAFPLG